MKKTEAYTYPIDQNSKDSHQTSPGIVLTFLRWKNRDPLRYSEEVFKAAKSFKNKDALDKFRQNFDPRQTRTPLVVENDCVQLTVSETKQGVTGSLQATLLSGDINYRTAIAPGDFVFANMLNWTESTDDNEVTVQSIAKRARVLQSINRFGDGFKGVFKVQNVRRGLRVSPDGKKQLVFFITAFSFTEFNNKMYFNPYLLDSGDKDNDTLFVTRISDQWNKIVSNKSKRNIQTILKLFITSFLGEGLSDEGKKNKGILKSPNDLFFMPQEVGKLLGIPKAKKAADIFNYILGIQKYTKTSSNANPRDGLSPFINKRKGRFFETSQGIDGANVIQPEYWNQKQVWSIMQQYLNSVINEMYTTHKVDPSSGRIMPTIVVRQKPFTTEHFGKQKNEELSKSATRFFNLPRWKISPNMIIGDLNLGSEEAARINFVQVFGRSIALDPAVNISSQIAKKNYVYDKADVQRNGLKPYIVTSNFDFPDGDDNKGNRAPLWTTMVADWVIGGHLKENGTIPLVGVQDPMPVGDNLELDGMVYHIESVTHNFVQGPEGDKTFRTNVSVSNGVDLRSNSVAPYYAEMEHTDIFTKKLEDYAREQMLPGYSDTQNIPGRVEGEEVKRTEQINFDPLKRKK